MRRNLESKETVVGVQGSGRRGEKGQDRTEEETYPSYASTRTQYIDS